MYIVIRNKMTITDTRGHYKIVAYFVEANKISTGINKKLIQQMMYEKSIWRPS